MTDAFNIYDDSAFSEAALIPIRHDRFCEAGAHHYALGMTYGVLQARALGIRSLDLYEFGVANGNGLTALINMARKMSALSGVNFRVFGFDSGAGMPAPVDYRDHPELFFEGQYPMPSQAAIKAHIAKNNETPGVHAELVLGDIRETVPAFIRNRLTSESPIGFASIDVDYYSSTIPILEMFKGPPETLLPATPLYLDDV